MLRRKRPSRAVTFDADHVPRSACPVCRHAGVITMCTRVRRGEEYVFECARCRAQWKILL